jgi:hypothetical protein
MLMVQEAVLSMCYLLALFFMTSVEYCVWEVAYLDEVEYLMPLERLGASNNCSPLKVGTLLP